MKPARVLLGLLAALPAGLYAATQTPARPSFVVVLAEAQGWANTSAQMDDAHPESRSHVFSTPAVESLAREGMRFAQGYAASPRCTPSRAALLTGRSPASLHMTYVGAGRRGRAADDAPVLCPEPVLELPAAEITLAELLKNEGYATAHFGKWHLGKVDPSRHGFDESDGPTGNGGPDNVASPNPAQAIALTDHGIGFMEKSARAGRPFYLQLSHYPNQEAKGGGKRPDAKADSDAVDATVAALLEAIRRLGLAESTYVIYTADHGSQGHRGNEPLSGGKGSLSEGGLRVPFVVRGPGVAAGVCSRVPVTACDLAPTLAELAGIRGSLPAGVEGGSLVGVLHDAEGRGVVKRPREGLTFHFPHYDLGNGGPASAIRVGDLKLVRNYATGARRLYNLTADIEEKNDLAEAYPAKVAELDHRLSDYLADVGAELPRPNPKNASKTAGHD